MKAQSSAPQMWYSDVPRSTRLPTAFGVLVIGLTVAGFGVWGGTAPIAGAVVASGVFVATGQNKIIQHLEGGVIREIRVREGDIVTPGQPLIHLDETAPRAELRRLVLRQARLTAMSARLESEAGQREELSFSDDLLSLNGDEDVAEILRTQRLTFEARQSNLKNEIATIWQGVTALQERIEGSKVQVSGVHRQVQFIDEEIAAKSELLKSGLVRKPEVLLLQRQKANLEGELGRLTGEIGDAKERIARFMEQIAGVKKTAVKTAVEQLHEIRADLTDVRERISAARKVLERVNITAPVEGVVVRLRYHTTGGVVEPGKNIMELLPVQDELIIEARVRPQDIDSVKRGQRAAVRLTALSQRVTPMVSGEVIYVSADVLADEKRAAVPSAPDIYLARIKLDAAEAAKIRGFIPTPGMPADVFIKTAERTFLNYLMKPIEDSMARAFRER